MRSMALSHALAWLGVLLSQSAVAGTFIVTLRDGASPERVARAHGLAPELVFHAALNGFAAEVSADALAVLKQDPAVRSVEADAPVRAKPWIGPPVASRSNWGLLRIDQRHLPLGESYRYSATGKGVTAYVIDTGIRFDHSEFGKRAHPGFDAYGGDSSDCDGHGTHVSAILGGNTFGVAKDVELVSVRVLNCGGYGSLKSMIAGIDWVAQNHASPAVANMSLVSEPSEALDTAVRNLVRSGVTVTVAAGNNSGDACLLSPGRVPEVITVGATDNTDHRWVGSNWGSCVTWFAPGANIVSAYAGGPSATMALSGTSMASPHGAGVVALYLEKHPRSTPEQVKEAISSFATHGIVMNARSANNDLLYSFEETGALH